MNEHPSLEQLSGYVLGTLNEPLADTVASHLASCDTCDGLVSQLENQADGLIQQLREAEKDLSLDPACQKVMALVQAMPLGRTALDDPPIMATARRDGPPPELAQIGPYQLQEKLGQGGMGAVYKALHRKLKRTVAIKILPPELTRDPRAIARFEREMEAVGKLDHSNIVRATDADEHDGTHYLVMEYVDGCDVSEVVRRHGPLAVADACELIRQAAIGLQHAHEHGLVHRDIKPSNLMLTREGVVKVLDLGLALLQQSPNDRELTTTGQVMGTVDYMSPEQAGGSHSVDIRADIYSLGATLYKLLTGVAPFAGEKYDTLMNKFVALAMEPHRPVHELRGDIPEDLARIVDRLLAKSPADRPATPGEVAAVLLPFAKEQHVTLLLTKPDSRIADTTTRHSSTTANHLSGAEENTAATGLRSDVPAARAKTSRTDIQDGSTLAAGPVVQLLVRPKKEGAWTRVLRHPPIIAAAIALLLLGAGGLYFGITILIKDKEGKVIGKVEVHEGTTAEVLKDGKKIAEVDTAIMKSDSIDSSATQQPAKKTPATRPSTPLKFSSDTQPKLEERTRLSSTALVARPAKLEGVESWTVETIEPREKMVAVTWSPKGDQLAALSSDGNVRLINPANGEITQVLVSGAPASFLHLYFSGENSMAFSPDGQLLALGANDGGIRIWDVSKSPVQLIRSFKHASAVSALCWSPDSRMLAASSSASLQLWDLTSKESTLLPFPPTAAEVCSVVWSPSKGKIAFGTLTALHIVTLQQGDISPMVRSIDSKGVHVRGLAWSPDGASVAMTYAGGFAVCNAETGEVCHVIKNDSPTPEATQLAWAPAPLGLRVVWGKKDGGGPVVASWMPENAQPKTICTVPQPRFALSAAFSPDGKEIAILADTEGRLRIMDTSKGNLRHSIEVMNGFDLAYSWSADGTTLVEQHGGAEEFRVWQIANGMSLLRTISIDFASEGHRVVMSGSGKQFAAWNENQTHVYDADTGEALARLNRGSFYRLVFLDEGTVLCSERESGELLQFNLKSGECTQRYELKKDERARNIAVSPRGTFFSASVFSSQPGGWVIFDVRTGRQIKSLPIERYAVWKDETTVAVSSEKSVEIWDITKAVRTARIAPSGVNERAIPIAWQSDGSLLVLVDGVELIHFGASRKRLGSTKVPAGLAFCADGKRGVLYQPSALEIWDVGSASSYGTIVPLANDHFLTLSADGHYAGSEGVEDSLVYVVQTAEGQQTLTPAEFAEKYGWRNDPSKVTLGDK